MSAFNGIGEVAFHYGVLDFALLADDSDRLAVQILSRREKIFSTIDNIPLCIDTGFSKQRTRPIKNCCSASNLGSLITPAPRIGM
ncbi:MAG: hypothetical protein JO189_20185 [Deltaproteobacteria bacterium]|nr:hypothetical protein [Deltaproteobacteria bacterium]